MEADAFQQTDAGFDESDEEVLASCERLRAGLGVKICTALVLEEQNCPLDDELLQRCANTSDLPMYFDPLQPEGSYRCVDDKSDFGGLCIDCVELGDRNGNGIPDECEPCIGDLDFNGTVDIADLLLVLTYWSQCPPEDCPGDANGDGVADIADLLLVLANWGPCVSL